MANRRLLSRPQRFLCVEALQQDDFLILLPVLTIEVRRLTLDFKASACHWSAYCSVRQFDQPRTIVGHGLDREIGLRQGLRQLQSESGVTLSRIWVAYYKLAVCGGKTGIDNFISYHAAPCIRPCNCNGAGPAMSFPHTPARCIRHKLNNFCRLLCKNC